ncbi:MAG: hypothetical protein HS111_05190 [Kofleriaceae bacterium]|nr:hypothetical protein [Kofleriaceae bacterium]
MPRAVDRSPPATAVSRGAPAPGRRRHPRARAADALAAVALAAAAGCSSVSTVRVQPENVAAGPGLRPIAAIQVNATAAYLLFIPIGGRVDLDRVVNRMLIVAAKTMGADKIAALEFEVTPDSGVWTLRKLLGWRSARASGLAVQVEAAPADPTADDGPEPPPPGPGAGDGAP